MPRLDLKFSLSFEAIQTTKGLKELDDQFIAFLKSESKALSDQLTAYRQNTLDLSNEAISDFLIAVSSHLDLFIADFFHITTETEALTKETLSHNPVGQFKKNILLQKVKKRLHKDESFKNFSELNTELLNRIESHEDLELSVAQYGCKLLASEGNVENELEQLIQWCIQAIKTQADVTEWSLFKLPQKLDYQALIPLETCEHHSHFKKQLPKHLQKRRDGFKLTDNGMTAREAQNEINYCIFCHDHDGDLCSKGFPLKKKQPELGFRKNPLGITLTGCPLEERISEMQLLKREGYSIAALAMVMLDNPMCPATGHRICNDCMKACIYQKQTPVNIPQTETKVLTDVLKLPWGVEIYELLTKWNPLRKEQYLTKEYNGKKILIAGMGPAGFTLSHHLLQEGYAVVGVDGLKLEPLPNKYISSPIRCFSEIEEELDERVISGFGGVAEYGITSRWNKNFLKLIYINLMRRQHFQVFGNVRFGGTIQVSDAWELGFDHMVIAVGAGLPKALPVKGSLVTGMRQANDFLMALQLTGAAKKTSLANLQIRLPAVVIGGGLTGVDAATELQAYYIAQVEKLHHRYHSLCEHYSESDIQKKLDLASIEILQEFLSHGALVIEERQRAVKANETPNFSPLLQQWGGVSIVYRKHIQNSPAYVNNHEELAKALEEGIYYIDCLNPESVSVDQHGHAISISCEVMSQKETGEWENTKESVTLPCKTILVATGASLNIAYAFEHPNDLERNGMQYRRYNSKLNSLEEITELDHCKQSNFGPYTSYKDKQHRVTFIGDTHPVFHGNVVKAIASAKRTYPEIHAHLIEYPPHTSHDYSMFSQKMQALFSNTITEIIRKTPGVIEISIHAPMAIKHYKPGQFYRLQNLETDAPIIQGTQLQTEGVAAIVIKEDRDTETLTFMIQQTGVSTKLFSTFKPGQAIALMGPTGVRSKISEHRETILIVGNELSLSQIRSYGHALKKADNTLVYMGIIDHPEHLYCQEEIEGIADQIFWVTKKDKVHTHRPEDIATTANPLDVLLEYAKNSYPDLPIPFSEIDRIQVIGDSDLLKQIQHLRKGELKPYLPKNPKFFGSVYSTMQCMLKGVCAQCLQWQVDPETGERKKAVFACSWQDQPLELIDYDNITERLRQNKLQEHMSNLWLDHIQGQTTGSDQTY
jgi:NADPH-dependent glutamate synthase beta subunit-like oxidoreductase/NAD(P)H-flavin reductase